jgi:hypothetical protein
MESGIIPDGHGWPYHRDRVHPFVPTQSLV